MNVRFGLYIIPEGDFFRNGSALVGYDIRTQRSVTAPGFMDPSWQADGGRFGFHASITDAISIDSARLPAVIQQTSQLLGCLKPENRYLLTKDRVGFWRDDSSMAIMVMRPNRSVELLHDVLVTSLHPLGSGSEYFDQYIHAKTSVALESPATINKIEHFYSPFIFDEFVPHFTCINNYTGPADRRSVVEQSLQQIFADITEVECHKLALVTQIEGEPHFKIEREFDLHAGR